MKKSGETGPPHTQMSSRPSREQAAEVPLGRLMRSGVHSTETAEEESGGPNARDNTRRKRALKGTVGG